MLKIETFLGRKNKNGFRPYCFRIRSADNGKIITPSQGYSRKVDRAKTIGLLRRELAGAVITNLDTR